MKGNQELVDALNGLLASELTSINQYMVHAEMAEDWGYTRLSENFKKRSITEMKPSASSSASCSWRARPSYPTSTTCTSARRSPSR